MKTKLDAFLNYSCLSRETLGPDDCRLVLTKWHNRNLNPSSRRFLVHTEDGRELFDTDDCYDAGNALHKTIAFLGEFEKSYLRERAGAEVVGAPD